MDTKHVKPFDPSKLFLQWSEPTQGGESVDQLAAGPVKGEFYFVSVDYDSVWAGIIIGKKKYTTDKKLFNKAYSQEVEDVDEGMRICKNDLFNRIRKGYDDSELANCY